MTTPDAGTVTQTVNMTYNDGGQVTGLVSPDGETLTSTYDLNGRLRSIYFGTPQSTGPVQFLIGQVSSTNDGQTAGLLISTGMSDERKDDPEGLFGKVQCSEGGYMPLQISLVHQFEQQQSGTWDVHFSLGGSRLVSSDGTALYLWQLHEDGSWSYEHSLPFEDATILRFAPDVALYMEEAFIKLISFDGGEVATFPPPSYPVWEVSPDLHWFVGNGKERTIRLWERDSRQSFSVPFPFPAGGLSGKDSDLSHGRVGRFLFTPDGQRVILFADSPEGSLHICSFAPEHRLITHQKTLPEGMIEGIISPDGKMFAIIACNRSYKQDIHVYDLESLQLLHVFLQTMNARYSLLAFSPDCKYLISCKTDGFADIFSLESFDCIAQFAAHPELFSDANDPIGGLAWSRTGYIATGGASVFEKDMEKTDYSIKLWKIEEE